MSNLTDTLLKSFSDHAGRRLVSLKKDFVFKRHSYRQVLECSLRFAGYLKKKGIAKGDRVAICSYNCPEYLAAFLGCMFSGVVVVPIDFGSSSELIEKFCRHTGARILILSETKPVSFKADIILIEQLFGLASQHQESQPVSLGDDDLLEILYTSGTTGDPKGVILTHGNVYWNVKAALQEFRVTKEDRMISILPLSHIFEQMAGLFAVIFSGASVTHIKSRRPSEIAYVMRYEKTTMMVAVPAFLMLFKSRIEERAKKEGKYNGLQGLIRVSRHLPIWARRLLFSELHKTIGGNLRTIICGGSPLPVEVETFWDDIGIIVVTGYGLTETSPILSLNSLARKKAGSVGHALPGVELKISGEGEILAKGRNISPGYYKNAEATEKLFAGGYLRTGDCGEFDSEGFLFIRGRLKNMIKKPSGLNIYPEDIEKVVDLHPLVKECCVLGIHTGNDVVTTAVILPREAITKKTAREIMKWANARVEPFQMLQDCVIWGQAEFPKTLTLKIKRAEVLAALKGNERCELKSDDPVIDILSKITRVCPSSIKDDSSLYSDLSFDSIKVIELSTMIDETMGVDLEESLIDSKTTVRGLRRMISGKSPHGVELKLKEGMFSWLLKPIKYVFPELAYLAISRFFTKVEIIGKENLKGIDTQVILITNHTSHLDAPTIYKYLPLRLRSSLATAAAADYFFVQDGSIKSRIVSSFFSYVLGAFPMSRDKDSGRRTSFRRSLEFIGEIADRGWSIALAPEGTRTRSGEMGKFKTGIGIIVKETGFPVIPIKIKGLYDIMPPSAKFPVKRGPVKIIIGKPVTFSASETPAEITQSLEVLMRGM